MRKLGLLAVALLIAAPAVAAEETLRARLPVQFSGSSQLAGEGLFLAAERSGDATPEFTLAGSGIQLQRMVCHFNQPCRPSGPPVELDGSVTLVEMNSGGGLTMLSDGPGSAQAEDGVLDEPRAMGYGPFQDAHLPPSDAVSFTGADQALAATLTGEIAGLLSGVVVEYTGTKNGRMETEPEDLSESFATVRIELFAEEAALSSEGHGFVAAVHPAVGSSDGANLALAAGARKLQGPVAFQVDKVEKDADGTWVLLTPTTAAALIPLGEEPAGESTPLPREAVVGAAAVAGFAAAAAAVWYWPQIRWLATVALLPLYSRIERGSVMEHENRERIYALVRENPGIHAHEIASRAGVGWGTAVYHLKMLEDHRLVIGERQGRYKRFFLAAGFTGTKDAIGALRNPTTSSVAEFIARNPGCIQREVCTALGLSPSLVNWHIDKLETAELVKKVREGRTVRYFAGAMWNAVAPQPVGPEPTAAHN